MLWIFLALLGTSATPDAHSGQFCPRDRKERYFPAIEQCRDLSQSRGLYRYLVRVPAAKASTTAGQQEHQLSSDSKHAKSRRPVSVSLTYLLRKMNNEEVRLMERSGVAPLTQSEEEKKAERISDELRRRRRLGVTTESAQAQRDEDEERARFASAFSSMEERIIARELDEEVLVQLHNRNQNHSVGRWTPAASCLRRSQRRRKERVVSSACGANRDDLVVLQHFLANSRARQLEDGSEGETQRRDARQLRLGGRVIAHSNLFCRQTSEVQDV